MASAQPDADMDTCVGSDMRLLATCHVHAKLQQSLHYHTRLSTTRGRGACTFRPHIIHPTLPRLQIEMGVAK